MNILAFIAFGFGGLIVAETHKNKHIIKSVQLNKIPKLNQYLVVAIIMFTFLIGFIFLKSTLGHRSLLNIEDQEFAQGGFEAHLSNIITIILILLIICAKTTILPLNKYIIIILIISGLILKIASSIKAELIIPIIGGIIGLILLKKIPISIKSGLITICLIFSLFAGMAMIFNFNENQNTLSYIVDYCFFYFSCGEIAFSQYIDNHIFFIHENIDFITLFFQNFYEKLYGSNMIRTMFDVTVTDWTTVTNSSCEYIFKSNVYSCIGEVYINCGLTIGLLFFMLLGFYSYIIFYILEKSNPFILVLYSYIGACLSLSFFSSYILLPSFIYIQFICIVLYILSKIKLNYLTNKI